MPCFYCGKRVSLVRQMADPDFCSDEHRKRYHDVGIRMLARLTDAPAPAKVEPKAPRPAPVRPAAPKRPAERPGPAVRPQSPLQDPDSAAGDAAVRETAPAFELSNVHRPGRPPRSAAVPPELPQFGFRTLEGSFRRRFARPRSAGAPRLTARGFTAMDRSWLVRANGLAPAQPVPAFPQPAGARPSPAAAAPAALTPASPMLPELCGPCGPAAPAGQAYGFCAPPLHPAPGPAEPVAAAARFAVPAAAASFRGDGRSTGHPAASCPPVPLEVPRPATGQSPAPRTCDGLSPTLDLSFPTPKPAPAQVHEPAAGNFGASFPLRPALFLARPASELAAPRINTATSFPASEEIRRRGSALASAVPVAEPAPAVRNATAASRPAAASFAIPVLQVDWQPRRRPSAPLRQAGFGPLPEPRRTAAGAPARGQADSVPLGVAVQLPGSAHARVRHNPHRFGFEPLPTFSCRGAARPALTMAPPRIAALLPSQPAAEHQTGLGEQPHKRLRVRRVNCYATPAGAAQHDPAIPAPSAPVHLAAAEACQGVPRRTYAPGPRQVPHLIPSGFRSEACAIAARALPSLAMPALSEAPTPSGRVGGAWLQSWVPAPERRPAMAADALEARGFRISLGLPELARRTAAKALRRAGPTGLGFSAPLKRPASPQIASAVFAVPAPEDAVSITASVRPHLRRPGFEPVATFTLRITTLVSSRPAAAFAVFHSPATALPALPGTEAEHVPAAAELRRVWIAAAKRAGAPQSDCLSVATPPASIPAVDAPLEPRGEPASLGWRTIGVKPHTIPAGYRTSPVAGPRLQRPAGAVPVLAARVAVDRVLPVSGFEPLAGAGTVLKVATRRAVPVSCSFPRAVLPALHGMRLRAAGAIGRGLPIVLPAAAVNVPLRPRMSTAPIPPRDPRPPAPPRGPRTGGISSTRFTPMAASPALRARERASEGWQFRTLAPRYEWAATPAVPAAYAPAQNPLQAVRLAIVVRVDLPAAPTPEQALAAPAPLPPSTPAGPTLIAVAPARRESVPSRTDDARTKAVAYAGAGFRPRKFFLLRRRPVLPRPGYPTFAFTLHEATDFDDDSTYATAAPCEAPRLAAVLPRLRHRRPETVRLPLVCGWVDGHVRPAGPAPAPVPHNGVVLAVKPVIAEHDAVPDEDGRVRLAAAVGEGESGRMWRTRLFR